MRTIAEVKQIARRIQRDPASASADELRTLALYVMAFVEDDPS